MCIKQVDSFILEVPQFVESVDDFSEQFGLSFAYDATKIRNDFPNNVHSATSFFYIRQKFESYLFLKAYPALL